VRRPGTRITLAAVGLAAATAIALLAIALGPHPIGDYYAESDFYGGYAPGAQLIQHGRLDPARYGVVGPVYEIVLAVVGWLTRDLFVAATAISILSAVAVLWSWFAVLRKLTGDAAALTVAALLAANPTFFRYGYSVTTDMLALALAAAALAAVLLPHGRWAPLAAGALCAVAALTRYSAIALLPGALAYYAWRSSTDRPPRARAIVEFLGGFVVIAVPWLILALRSGTAPGGLLFHDIAYDIYASARGQTWADYQTRLQPGFHSLVDVVARDPAAVLRREGGNLLSHLPADAKELLGWPAALLCVAGLLVALLEGTWRRLASLAPFACFFYLALVPAFYSARYALALAPFELALAGALVASPWLARHARLGRVPLTSVAAAIVLAISLAASVKAQREVLETVPREVIPVARALRDHAGAEARVMATKPQIAFESNAALTPMPATSRLDEVAERCRSTQTQFLYYSWIELNNRPSFWYLLDPESTVPGLVPVLRTRDHPAVLDRVGPEFDTPPAWLADDSLRAASERRVIAAMPAAWAWRAQLSIAIADFEQQRFRDALDHATAVVRERPGESMAWRIRANASLRLGDFATAEAAFERALDLEPDAVPTRIMLGWTLLARGQESRAAAVWKPAVGAVSDRSTLERMIVVFSRAGDDAAVAQARAALARLGAR
jgi:tetratricopeptide (TPR) repeat protein